ncbi:uncharacterized protein LOC126686108 [Mercurialis annua]|uniref:uncharacterized protein LOC126686108 n=1 Tax=Mercurialis annua TaxID=3986 RepID=UPI002160D7A1|nr:uncharacterized protein LOC126686108 [Mercurialis annua]
METLFSHWDYLVLLILRPILAVSFVFLLILIGWLLAWKLVLVHVPLVQEIFGLRKKPAKIKPTTRRLSKYYNSINSRNSDSG